MKKASGILSSDAALGGLQFTGSDSHKNGFFVSFILASSFHPPHSAKGLCTSLMITLLLKFFHSSLVLLEFICFSNLPNASHSDLCSNVSVPLFVLSVLIFIKIQNLSSMVAVDFWFCTMSPSGWILPGLQRPPQPPGAMVPTKPALISTPSQVGASPVSLSWCMFTQKHDWGLDKNLMHITD